MKKRLLAMILSALLVANISSCVAAPEDEIGEPFENTDTTESNFEETDEKTTESEIDADIKASWKGSVTCNGVFRNSKATYTYDPNSGLSIHIADWNEDRLVTSFSNMGIISFKFRSPAIGVNNERAFLLFLRFYESANTITVVSFEKGSQSETVVTLDVDEAVYEISGNFINENTGYLFAFKEEVGGHSRGSSKLTNLFKTEDGGNTWNAIDVQHMPLLNLREPIIYAKMINENVGMISGTYAAADCNFCERTLLTTDGGLNWVNITGLPQIDGICGPNVIDFTQVEDAYILTLQDRASDTKDVYTYKSSNLTTWSLIN